MTLEERVLWRQTAPMMIRGRANPTAASHSARLQVRLRNADGGPARGETGDLVFLLTLTPEETSAQIRLIAALKMFELGKLSLGRAAKQTLGGKRMY